jgi:hypothetical protein
MTTDLHAITATRLQMHRNGYHPVPIIGAHVKTNSAGKRPTMSDWHTRCLSADEPEIESWQRQHDCTNTGMLSGTVSGVDIDVLDPALSDRINAMAIERLGPTPLKRIGRAPKTLLCYRLNGSIKKLSTPELFFGDDVKATKGEILGDGQQLVAFGIHPETNAEYYWPEKSPLDIHADAIPLVTAEALTAFIVEAEQMIRDAGGRTKAEIKAADKPPAADTKPSDADMPDKIAALHESAKPKPRCLRKAIERIDPVGTRRSAERSRLSRLDQDGLRAPRRPGRCRVRCMVRLVGYVDGEHRRDYRRQVEEFRQAQKRHGRHAVLLGEEERLAIPRNRMDGQSQGQRAGSADASSRQCRDRAPPIA